LSGRPGAAGCADATVAVIVKAAASKIVFTIIVSSRSLSLYFCAAICALEFSLEQSSRRVFDL
jgi:hypothetical protein